MSSRITKIACLFFSLACCVAAFGPALAAGSGVVLNDKALQDNLAARVTKELGAREKDPKPFPPANVKIIERSPFQVGEFNLVAVKVRFEPDRPGQQPGVNYLVVNPGGDKILEIQDVVSGRNLLFEPLAEIKREELAPDVGTPILTGSGKNLVVMVSDPFCSHCRQAFKYLSSKTGAMREVRLVHLPVSGVVSDAACAMIDYAGHVGVSPAEAAEFAYTGLKKPVPPEGIDPAKVNLAWEIVAQFRARFPLVDKALPGDRNEAWEQIRAATAVQLARDRSFAAEKIINFTPALFVDGVRLDGFIPAELEQALELAGRRR
ncbi:MAG: hypothetical protein V1816_07805 [Pseudomonadota bacterium]